MEFGCSACPPATILHEMEGRGEECLVSVLHGVCDGMMDPATHAPLFGHLPPDELETTPLWHLEFHTNFSGYWVEQGLDCTTFPSLAHPPLLGAGIGAAAPFRHTHHQLNLVTMAILP